MSCFVPYCQHSSSLVSHRRVGLTGSEPGPEFLQSPMSCLVALGVWSSGMIPVSGTGGPGFDSRHSPSFAAARGKTGAQRESRAAGVGVWEIRIASVFVCVCGGGLRLADAWCVTASRGPSPAPLPLAARAPPSLMHATATAPGQKSEISQQIRAANQAQTSDSACGAPTPFGITATKPRVTAGDRRVAPT